MNTSRRAEIAVIGAGFAGLAAAVELSRAGQDVTLFEARDRVGGRVWSDTIEVNAAPVVIERGAEFVLNGYDAMRGYLAHYRLDLVDTGMSYYVRDTPELPGVTRAKIAALGAEAARAAARLTAPTSVAALLDSLNPDADVRAALEARIEISSAAGSELLDARGVFDNVASTEPATSWRVSGGNQRLADELATEIRDRLRLRQPITAITAADDGLAVHVDGSTTTFDYVVVALPFGLLQNDVLHVELPEWKRSALSRLVQGNAAKLHVPLAAAPPHSAVMSVKDRYWTWTAVDATGTVAPVLNGFGGNLDSLLALGVETGPETWTERARALRPDLEFADGASVVTAWHLDPWARGAYACHTPDFTAEDAAALQRPVGNVFFAGEYTDPENTGLMEGALRSGRRVAAEILEVASRRGS